MKRVIFLAFALIFKCIVGCAQGVAPAKPYSPVNAQFYVKVSGGDTILYQNMGAPYGWQRVPKYKELARLNYNNYFLGNQIITGTGYYGVVNADKNASLSAFGITVNNTTTGISSYVQSDKVYTINGTAYNANYYDAQVFTSSPGVNQTSIRWDLSTHNITYKYQDKLSGTYYISTLDDITQALANYLPLSGGNLSGPINGTSANFSSSIAAQNLVTTSYGGTLVPGDASFGFKIANSSIDHSARKGHFILTNNVNDWFNGEIGGGNYVQQYWNGTTWVSVYETNPTTGVLDFKIAPTINGAAIGTGGGSTAARNMDILAWTYSTAYALTSVTRDANEAIVTGSVVWPDGSTGTFTTDTFSTSFPGAVDAYHVTYVPSSGPTKTITQSLLTRDASGAVTAQPALTII